jgi:glucosyl-dolichyl phosphate glucuronosyltransferase
VISTHNRPKDLLACLAALTFQERGDVEIIVVDSASEPPAREALAQFFADHPGIRLHRLDLPGVSLARNIAVSLSRGRWLAFLDDDAVPDPSWAEEILALLKRLPPKTGAVGLYTYPIWPQDRDPGLPPLWFMYLSLRVREWEGDCTNAPDFVAANMLMRREAVIEAGGFAEHLARRGQLLLSGDEVYVAEKMRRKGWSIWYSCRPRAGHRIPRERLTAAWFRKRMFCEGVTFMMLRRELDGAAPLFPVARALAFSPILFVLSLADSPFGTRRARAMWHLGIAYYFFVHLVTQRLKAVRAGYRNRQQERLPWSNSKQL